MATSQEGDTWQEGPGRYFAKAEVAKAGYGELASRHHVAPAEQNDKSDCATWHWSIEG